MSTGETEESQSGYEDGGGGGPGAPTPLSALEVLQTSVVLGQEGTNIRQGVGGLSARDIKLIVEGGFHTVESVAYT